MIYLDNAATTFPKPPSVTDAVLSCMREYCGNPGRSSHPLALRAAEAVYDARTLVAALLGISKPENVVFTSNATSALNKVILPQIKPGSHVIITNLEHNSVLRPVANACRAVGASFDTIDATANDDDVLSETEAKITKRTNLIITIHASNICSRVLPTGRIGALCKKHGITYVVDASQSAGIYDIDIMRDNISVLCAPGHKGLFGPQGTGFAAFADDYDFSRLSPREFGGNGMNSAETEMGFTPPESYEAGTINVPGIAGLCEGIRFINSFGREKILRHEKRLWRLAANELLSLGAKIYMPEYEGGVLLFNMQGKSGSGIAEEIGEFAICTRAGLHCAPTAHRALRTGGDAVRISFSAFSRDEDVFRLCSALKKIGK